MAQLHWNESAEPAKIDLADGTKVFRTSAWAPPGCHGVGCGLKVFVKDGKLVKVEGDPDQPITKGRLCPRCMAIKDYVEHPDRLKYPMKRAREFRGRADKWERISWDEAYDIIIDNWRSVRERYGKNAVSVFAGTGREASRYHFTMAQDVFGSNTAIQSISGWSCIIPRMAGMAWVIGAPYLEVDNAIGFPERYDSDKWQCPKYILNWGRDPLRSNPDGLWGHSIIDMMKCGAKLINVDPRVNWMSTRAEYYLQLRPGTDAALALGILNEIIQSGEYDKEFVDSWTYGFDELAVRAAEYPVERVADICEVDPDHIRAVARCLLERPSTLSMGLAVDQNPNSIQIAHALLAIFAITGNIDVPGGVFLGQPLLMFQALQGESAVEENPSEPEIGIGHDVYPALPAVANTPHPDIVLECLETGRPQRIEFAYILNTNPLACMPAQPQRWYEALRKIEFIACADIFMTPTMAALADVALPVCTSLERDGIVTNNQASMHGQLGAMINVIDRIGDTKSDLEIAIDLHKRTHPDCADEKWRDVESFLTSDLKPVRDCDVTFPELKEHVFGQYELEYKKYEKGLLRDDGQPGFRTPTGRIELYCSMLAAVGEDPLPYYLEPPLGHIARPEFAKDYPLTMTSGARRFTSFHSEHRQIERLREIHPWPTVQINPKTAEKLGIAQGTWVYVETPWGKVKEVADITPVVKEDVVSCDHGWWYPERKEEDLFDIWETSFNQVMPHRVVGKTGFGAPYKCLPCKVYVADQITKGA